MADFRRNKKSGGRNRNRNDDSWEDSGRPVKRDSGRPRRDSNRFNDRRSDRMEKTTVSCDSCKRMCEVPFKPTSNKPVYCDDCFRKGPSSRPKDSNNELAEINKKLDKIIKMLNN